MRKYLILILLMSLQMVARGQKIDVLDSLGLPHPTAAKSMRYWLDDDDGSVTTVSSLDGKYSIDVASLLNGLHTIHYQIVDSENKMGPAYSSIFLKVAEVASASKATTLRYWYDDDANVMTCNANEGVYQLDASRLLNGLHTLHYQVVDAEGQVSYIASSIFLKMESAASASKATTLRYWYDDDTNVMTCNANVGVQQLDASGLLDGLHTLHYQVVDADGQVSYIASNIFLKMRGADPSEQVTASKLIYWFDDQQEATTIETTDAVQVLDASALLDGLHTIHYLVVCSDGSITSAYSSIFLRMSVDTEATIASRMRYWFDDEAAFTEVEVTTGTMTLDASHLLDGLHTVHYQLIDQNGASATPMSSIFLRMTEGTATTAQNLRYWFDDDTDAKTTSVADGNQTLDVSGLLTGLHTLHYQLVDSEGNVCSPMSGIFLKRFDKVVESSENVITQYTYWMNDNSADNHKVKITNPSSPYQLITLLPTIKAPIRTSSFHFEVKDGVPMIYAKNDLHVRFEDAAGYWVDDSRSFVDYSVSKVINNVSELQSAQTFARPDNNQIKWFKLEALPGDTIAFKASQATSLQVFAPSGKEIYSASGDKSVKYGGAHTWEKGTYYVAVHDVTGSKPNITLDYMHMDKYDVVSQDVHVVGNGGCSTITFQGNGFRDLYQVDLYTAHGDTIHSIDVGHESDATTTVTFDFTGAELGKYNAVFHFTEEDKTFTNNITVEEAKDIELATKVSYPSTFLKGTTTTFTFEITNKGNSTAYQVPVNIQFFAERGCQDITYAKYSENIPKVSMDWLCPEIYPQETIDAMNALVEEKGDLLRLINVVDTLKGVSYKDSYLAINIAPNSTFSFTITLKSGSEVRALMSIPDVWNFVSIKEAKVGAQYKYKAAKSSAKETMCCAREHVECFMNVIVSALDFASIFGPNWSVADCIGALANEGLQFAYDVWCGETYGGKNAGEAAKDLRWTAVNTLLSCLPPGVDKYNLVWIYEHIYDVISTTMDCVQSLSEIKGCPPNPPLPIGPSTPVNSYDPNDIYGYIAPSGSMYVGDEVLTLPYRIEFENDTTFATSAAHTVVVKDTLDATKFDLTSYQPTSIKIGDKDVQLKGDKEFVTTVDMRPAINAIAQVEGLYDEKKGIAIWQFTSLDPMTMEPTDDIMQGFLPVNFDGNGIGEVAYNINLRPGLADGTEINNRASITFDANDPILTPKWANIIDAVPPTSHVSGLEQVNDTIMRLTFDGEDNRSGVWKYTLYVQDGLLAPWREVAADIAPDSVYTFQGFDCIDYGFCVLATDSAGNVEKKQLTAEAIRRADHKGDANSDGYVTVADLALTASYILGAEPEGLAFKAADVNADGTISVADLASMAYYILNGEWPTEAQVRAFMRGHSMLQEMDE